MTADLVKYLRSLYPALDVLGTWVYLGNPKTAQKSIAWSALRDRVIHVWRGRRNWNRVWDHIIVPKLDECFLFTFVRNPWDKVVSAFHFLQQRGEIADHWAFHHYVKRVLGIQGTAVDVHFRPQLATIRCNGARIPGLYIGRFEHLESHWKYITTQIHAPRNLRHHNASRHAHYTTCYDDESREIVRELYQEEIEALDYTFGQ